MQPVGAPFDVVLTTNSGYPLDQNLYQSVKGMSAAAEVVKPGGHIVCVAECRDGLPDHGAYAAILAERGSPAELLEMINSPGYSTPDQWQVQIQAQIQMKADVTVVAGCLDPGADTGGALRTRRRPRRGRLKGAVSLRARLDAMRVAARPPDDSLCWWGARLKDELAYLQN